MKRINPFRVVEVIIKSILVAILAVMFAFLLLVLPVALFIEGHPWHVALAPWWIVLGVIAFYAAAIYLAFKWLDWRERWDRS